MFKKHPFCYGSVCRMTHDNNSKNYDKGGAKIAPPFEFF